MTDTRAAAERLRRVKNGEDYKLVYSPDHSGEGYILAAKINMELDRKVLADAYLELVPADDGEAVTGGWLLSLKGITVESTACGVKITGCRPYILYEHEPEAGLKSFYLGEYEIWKRKSVTRGMVRRLLAALGVGT